MSKSLSAVSLVVLLAFSFGAPATMQTPPRDRVLRVSGGEPVSRIVDRLLTKLRHLVGIAHDDRLVVPRP
jgi:hypothetical protein